MNFKIRGCLTKNRLLLAGNLLHRKKEVVMRNETGLPDPNILIDLSGVHTPEETELWKEESSQKIEKGQ